MYHRPIILRVQILYSSKWDSWLVTPEATSPPSSSLLPPPSSSPIPPPQSPLLSFFQLQCLWLASSLGWLHHGRPSGPDVCSPNFCTSINVCGSYLGLLHHPDKCAGRSYSLVVIGIELHSVNQVARLPEHNLIRLRLLFDSWACRRWCRRNELESLINSRTFSSWALCVVYS